MLPQDRLGPESWRRLGPGTGAVPQGGPGRALTSPASSTESRSFRKEFLSGCRGLGEKNVRPIPATSFPACFLEDVHVHSFTTSSLPPDKQDPSPGHGMAPLSTVGRAPRGPVFMEGP